MCTYLERLPRVFEWCDIPEVCYTICSTSKPVAKTVYYSSSSSGPAGVMVTCDMHACVHNTLQAMAGASKPTSIKLLTHYIHS